MGSLRRLANSRSADRYFQDTAAELEKLVAEGVEGACPTKAARVDHSSARRRPARRDELHGQHQHRCQRKNPKFRACTGAGSRESHVHDVQITKEAA